MEIDDVLVPPPVEDLSEEEKDEISEVINLSDV